ncbi:MAG: cation acetate symporter [Planctomycetes bacterium]|nr:cation acetate symporter [Planctomycetota bacterium]
MIYERSTLAVAIFAVFVGITLGLSFYLGRRAKSASGYFAAGGHIHWFVNGIAFAGDYLSAASFLGICGMIAFYGYDGFLYSIGYLAGWIVALFVVAEPLKRMGKFTFADALDSRFHSRGIKLSAAISTLAVSIFYLIPQMVGAGALIKPLLGFSHATGVITVGAVVILIVTTAGMVSTTYVQFIKGSLLVVFSTVLVVMILNRGLIARPWKSDPMIHHFRTLNVPTAAKTKDDLIKSGPLKCYNGWKTPMQEVEVEELLPQNPAWQKTPYVRLHVKGDDVPTVWRFDTWEPHVTTLGDWGYLRETQTVTVTRDGKKLVNGKPQGRLEAQGDLFPVGQIDFFFGEDFGENATHTGSLGPIDYLEKLSSSRVTLWGSDVIKDEDGSVTTVYYPKHTHGRDILLPGNHPTFKGIRSDKLTDKLNFLSLMLALFGGTASLPHILIRYYTVKDQASARKSTIVGIASIGFFYVLTLYIGLGAMTSGALDVTNSNMAAPLLAKSFGEWLFAIISAIAFTTVLGTVSGLIIAASGAVAHDICGTLLKMNMTDSQKIRIAKIASVGVGLIAIVLGILFEKMNVSYLVGWAFSVAASANLPSLIMLIFWPGTTKQGITASITVGVISSLSWILLSADTFKDVYGSDPSKALVPFSQPGIVTIPLGFAVLIGVSLLTRRREVVA